MLRKFASYPMKGNHPAGFHRAKVCKASAYLPLLAEKQSRQ